VAPVDNWHREIGTGQATPKPKEVGERIISCRLLSDLKL